MKAVAALLVLLVLTGCGTIVPSRQSDLACSSNLNAIPIPPGTEASLGVRGVHGLVQYWDGGRWASLRPNMVLTNGAQIRPGADSCVDLSSHCFTVRLQTDAKLNIQALLVRHGKVVGAMPIPQVVEWRACPPSFGEPSPPAALQIQAGGFAGQIHGADFAIYPDGDVKAIAGQLSVTGRGKTYRLRDGQYFDARRAAIRRESGAKGDAPVSLPQSLVSFLVVYMPQTWLFESGQELARR